MNDISTLDLINECQSATARWLNLHTNAMIIMNMLDRGGFDAIIGLVDFDQLEKMAKICPELAKKLANPR